ncbi:MAG TPA: FAD-dependent oxidoreductase [Erwinia persicina]|uniref:FAD-dependent oxidoreductase n=1 Tax=Erwinia persicina TaxID=55211 RepID=A0ABR8ZV70_9GAMM|nr:FAD-dependent oxidoreductase [Erwinia persicina]AXU95824.1 FAD-dependent oxidoreductase [Erwinia persicina]MBC3945470.1 FAD-dependent oxidoreductase [Erwinia persicina]MBD8107346.1 FAD-dependent oxidoreductase [Erwinia persicina]MBD8166415.1 FAD-dependent oxidoreductase [Erwinia persicina]MBD8210434.1 FAD-dependent oxidoreductase [Erwinia persicina]
MRVAIIGSGIAGLSCAWKLAPRTEVHLYESGSTLGGHTATVDVELDGKNWAIDTGFIVFNDRTYPRFLALLAELGLESQPTEMSFSVRNTRTGLEYNGHSLSSLFAQRSNLLKPSFYRFLAEIVRFNRCGKQWLTHQQEQGTLDEFLTAQGFSDFFARHYILPMGAAIWSVSLSEMRRMPLTQFLNFFNHHGLLDLTHRPQWYVVPGGSREYIRRLMQLTGQQMQVYLDTPVTRVTRDAQGVTLESARGVERYDQVIFACHSDQALHLLHDASQQESEMLAGVPYRANEVVLHTDTSLLPKSRAAWASWNYRLNDSDDNSEQQGASVTYNMNILQGIASAHTFCVSLNPTQTIDPAKVLRRFEYHHPQFGPDCLRTQQQRLLLNGTNRTWFCGAWSYNGFHEDGIRSALDVVVAMDQAGLL